MKKRRFLIFLILICTAMVCFAVPVRGEETDDGESDWTVMFYLCGTDLESRYGFATEILSEIAKIYPYYSFYEHELVKGDWGLVNERDKSGLDGVNIVIETGGCKEWHIDKNVMPIDTSALQYWHFYNDPANEAERFYLDQTLPLQSMADPETLTDFIRWSAENYPAKKYALVLWDHGVGACTGIFIDELFNKDVMYLDELGNALKNSGVHLETVILDACMMANIETACAIGDSANWMVASEEVVSGRGTAVGAWLQQLCYIPEMDGAVLGRLICDTTEMRYCQTEDKMSQDILTWSVIDLRQADRLRDAFDHIFTALAESYEKNPLRLINICDTMIQAEMYGSTEESQWDLADIFFSENERLWDPTLRREVLSVIQDAVVYNVRGSGRSGARGISFCYAMNFNCKKLEIYSRNCPSPHYLALLDAISPWTAPDWVYEKAERLRDFEDISAFKVKVEKMQKPDGTPLFNFVIEEGQEWVNTNVIRMNLYRKEESGLYIHMGMLPVDFAFWEENDEFFLGYGVEKPWLWPALEGMTCSMNVVTVNRPGWSEYLANIPISIDGGSGCLRCGYNGYENLYTVYGIWDGYESNSEVFNRNVRTLAQSAGRDMSLLYSVYTGRFSPDGNYYRGSTQTVTRGMIVEDKPLPPGEYYIEYVVYDLFMRPMYLEWAEMQWDGENAAFPHAEEWQGKTEMTIPEEFW